MQIRIDDVSIGNRFRRDMGDIDTLAQSIAEVGLLHPIVITPDNMLIAGRRRLEAYKLLGLVDILATVVDLQEIARGEFAENEVRKDFTLSEKDAISRAIEPIEREAAQERMDTGLPCVNFTQGKTMDKVAHAVGTSRPTLAKIREVVDSGDEELIAQMDETGKVDGAYRKLKHKQWAAIDELSVDRALELASDWEVTTGQVWQLGRHRLACGDCEDRTLASRLLGEDKPIMLLNDPPYGMALDTDYSKLPSTKPEGNKIYTPMHADNILFQYKDFGLDCAEEFWFGADYYRKSLPDGGSWLVWDKRVEEKFDAMFGSAFELIWSKIKHKREIIRCNNTLFSGEKEAKNKLHPTIKPLKVIAWIVTRYSEEGDTIADFYAGSGTTILACERNNRTCVAIEIEPKYIAVALQRWTDETGIEPTLLEA